MKRSTVYRLEKLERARTATSKEKTHVIIAGDWQGPTATPEEVAVHWRRTGVLPTIILDT